MPNRPSPLQKQAPRNKIAVAKIEAKDYNLNFDREEVEHFIDKVERISQIEGEKDKDLAIKMAFWTTGSRISDEIKSMPDYEKENWTQLREEFIEKCGSI
ncbi:hypothetical protein O181_008721 [Austropuccinia psidii MF-1]|uniref:Uncharacterized protein n=1 Tax=Austropuccinia psidii MF-1 TaxID=1389203 RepID=A0A9Q3BN06_9BASI|nr:hypothetical protein [Austropuccinia psidii MF-1]